MTITPSSLGLPARFTEFRSPQLRALKLWASCQKRHLVMPMPTGTGKSLAVVAAALQAEGRTLILTRTRNLQDQYARDFSAVAYDIRGKSNYPCAAPLKSADRTRYGGKTGEVSCDFAPCSDGIKCELRADNNEDGVEGCDYYLRLARARQSKVVVTNYAKWLAEESLGTFDTIVLDEAHGAGDALCSYLAFEQPVRRLHFYHLDPPTSSAPAISWVKWALAMKERLKAQATSKGASQELRRLYRAVELLAAHGREDWVVTHSDSGYVKIQPVWPFDYLNLLTGEIPRVVLMSATLTRKTVELLGIGKGDFDYREFACPFDKTRRPVYYYGVAKVDYRGGEKAVTDVTRVIDGIIRKRPGRRGIVHSVSYARARQIYEASTEKGRLILHDRNTSIGQVINRYLENADGVIVSPSATEGVDLPHEGCRFQILPKVPFPDRRDPVCAARCAHDGDYLFHTIGETITQTYGRAMRTEDDWGETFILDKNWGWIREKVEPYVPDWFWEAHKQINAIPAALEF